MYTVRNYTMRRLFIFIIIILYPLQVFSMLDDTELRLQKQFNTPLRWDNIEDKEPWLDGVKPEYKGRYGFHTVTLGCGEYVQVRLYKGKSLRIYNPEDEFRGDEIDIYLSNGSGLYITYPYSIDQERSSLLLTPPERIPYVVRIENTCKKEKIEIGLFCSRYEYIENVAPYRNLIELPLEKVWISMTDKLPTEAFYLLMPYSAVSVKIKGGAAFSIESRYVYNPYDAVRLQPYHIQVRLDGMIFKNIDHESLPHTTTRVYVNGDEKTIGRTQEDFMNIPEGEHELVIETDAILYIRLLRRDEPDHLFTINEPSITAKDIRMMGSTPVLRKSPWGINEYDMIGLIKNSPSPALLEFMTSNLIKDNTLQESDIIGTMLLMNVSMDSPYASEAARLYYLSHTFYRDIPPDNSGVDSLKRFFYFINPSLRDVTQPYESVLNYEHLEDALRLLPSSIFTGLTSVEDRPLVFHIPERPSPSFIRFIISKEGMDEETRLMMQLDNAPPLTMKSYRDETLRKKDFMTTQGEEALNILSSLQYYVEPSTLGGRFSSIRPPAPIIDAGYFEMPLPKKAKVIKLWKRGQGIPMVALQYRASRDYSLPQSAFMRYTKSIVQPHNLIIRLLRDGEETLNQIKESQDWGFPFTYTVKPGDTLEGIFRNVMGLKMSEIYNGYIERFKTLNPDIRDINQLRPDKKIHLPIKFLALDDIIKLEILNDLIPFYRLINARAKNFMASIERQNLPTIDGEDRFFNTKINHAKNLYSNGEYLKAFETLQYAIYQKKGIERDEAELLQADILKAVGEHFLMENLLKGIFTYSGYEVIRQRAFEKLSAYYKETKDIEGLISLYSVSLLKNQELRDIPELLNILLEEGEYEMVLKIGLLLPYDIQPVEVLIRASFEKSWWDAFDIFIERLQSPRERYFWMAKRMLKEGDYEKALELFKDSGAVGEKWYEWIREADSIYYGLKNINDSDIYKLIKRWQVWQAEHPGPFRWRIADELLIDSSGGMSLYNRARNMYLEMFLAKEDRPVKFKVYGPLSVRIEARPLYETDLNTPFNGWIELKDNGISGHYPINDNIPSDALTVLGEGGFKIGQKVMLAYDINEGLHHIEIYSRDTPLLVRIYVMEPELRVPILPPISPDTISALAISCDRNMLTSVIQEVLHQIHDTNNSPVIVSVRDVENRDVIKEMIDLLWEAEHNDEKFNDILAMAEALFLRNHHIPSLKPLINRLYKKTILIPFQNIVSSGGIRIRGINGEKFTTPEMRVRTAMLSPLMPGEHLLYGYERIILNMKNLKEKDLELTITTETIAYLPLEPMEIFFELDGEKVKEVLIGENGKRQVELHLRIEEGEHYLTIGISKPMVDQFLRIKVWERHDSVDIPLIKTVERRYYLATMDEPVVIVAKGPLLLHIEKMTNDESKMSYMEIGEGLHTLRFYPESPDTEALFRFYRREPLQEKPSTPHRRFAVEYKGAIIPPIEVNEPSVPEYVGFDDRLSLGSQEDGTLSVTGSFLRRRQAEAEERLEEFIELRLTHRFFDEFSRKLKRYEVMDRIRKYGGPTLGFIGHIAYRPLETKYNFNLNASLYLQKPSGEGNVEHSLNLDASIIDKMELGIKTYHTPSLAAFLRVMSMDDYDGYKPEEVDQDIFTPYKAEHKYGLRISDTLFYRPWLDSVLSLYGKVVTNEDLNPFKPDHYGFEVRWRQLIRNFQTDISYQENHYLRDSDRDKPVATRRIDLGASFEKWLNLNKRLEIGLELIWHLNINEVSGKFYLSIHFGKGRGYRDFQYGDIDFLDLRQMHISYEDDNNRILQDRGF